MIKVHSGKGLGGMAIRADYYANNKKIDELWQREGESFREFVRVAENMKDYLIHKYQGLAEVKIDYADEYVQILEAKGKYDFLTGKGSHYFKRTWQRGVYR